MLFRSASKPCGASCEPLSNAYEDTTDNRDSGYPLVGSEIKSQERLNAHEDDYYGCDV